MEKYMIQRKYILQDHKDMVTKQEKSDVLCCCNVYGSCSSY